MVEHSLAKAEVEGSSPSFRSWLRRSVVTSGVRKSSVPIFFCCLFQSRLGWCSVYRTVSKRMHWMDARALRRKSAFLHPLLQHSWNWIFVDRIFSGSWIRQGPWLGIPTAPVMRPLSQFVMNSLPIRSHPRESSFLSSWVIKKSRKKKEWLFRHADSAMSFFFFTRSAFWKKMPFLNHDRIKEELQLQGIH